MVEIIIVIVILAVLSVGSVQFISYSALGYVDTVRLPYLDRCVLIPIKAAWSLFRYWRPPNT